MKFLFTLPGWYLGGFVTFCSNLAAGLESRGHQVALLVLPHASTNRPVEAVGFSEQVIIPRGVSRVSSYVRRVAAEIDRLRPDVLVINDSAYVMAALPYIDRAILRMPVVHSSAPAEVKLGMSNPRWWDRVIGVSEGVGQAVMQCGEERRVAVCEVGVAPRLASGSPIMRKSPPPVRLVSAGRVVEYQKRMDRVPVIAALLARMGVNFVWTILGDGDFRSEMERRVGKMGLAGRFSFPGSVPPHAVAEAFRQAHVFVMPSDSEGMPQALLEAMAEGAVPVVSRLEGSTTCVVDSGQSGVLCGPGDLAGFASAIAELANCPDRVALMGRRAAERIAGRFSVESFTNRFLGILDETRARENLRPQAKLSSSLSGDFAAFRCLGFWRSLRHQTLGQMKRWILARGSLNTAPGAIPPTWR